jgi:hypothetical protein
VPVNLYQPNIEYTANIPHNQAIRLLYGFYHLDYHKNGYCTQTVPGILPASYIPHRPIFTPPLDDLAMKRGMV